MTDGFKCIQKQMEEHADTHTRILLPERKALIRRQYELLASELEDEADFSYCEEADAVHLTITADSLLTCAESGQNFNFLMGLADCSEIRTEDSRIVVYLWFRCWKWVENC